MPGGTMFRMQFAAVYTRDRSADGQEQMSLFINRAKGTPEQQARLAELDAKDRELGEARDRTRDRAEKDRIRTERKAVQAEAEKLRTEIMEEYQQWVASGGATAAMQQSGKAHPPDELGIRVFVNDDISLNTKAAPCKVEGAALAFEQAQGCEGMDDCCLTVLLGPYRKTPFISDHDRYKLPEGKVEVSTQARGLCLTVRGPQDKPEAVHALLKQVDLARLAALLP
jgi:hypothetical protein